MLYGGTPLDDDVERRVLPAGGVLARPRGPAWQRSRSTFVDPDGYSLVVSHRSSS